MKNTLIQLLESLGYEAYDQGSLTTTEEYPDSFFTVWNNDTENRYYNNELYNTLWSYIINFYSIDPNLPESILEEARTLLISNGWIVQGKGKDSVSDSKNHSGREINAYFIEKV